MCRPFPRQTTGKLLEGDKPDMAVLGSRHSNGPHSKTFCSGDVSLLRHYRLCQLRDDDQRGVGVVVVVLRSMQ
jgi:hypothetical protein